jgi:hypothetical protein
MEELFYQLVILCRVNNVRQTEIHTVELRPFRVDTYTEQFKRCKSLCIAQVPAELIQAVGMAVFSDLLSFGMKNCHVSPENLLLCMFINSAMEMASVIIEEYHCYQLHIKLYPMFFCPHVDGSDGDYKRESDVTDQVLIRYILKCSDNGIYSQH